MASAAWWGCLLTGVFAKDVGLIYGQPNVPRPSRRAGDRGALSFGGSWLLYKLTDMIIPLRVTEDQEMIGLDLSQHGETVSSRGVRAAAASMQGSCSGLGRPSEAVGQRGLHTRQLARSRSPVSRGLGSVWSRDLQSARVAVWC